MKMSRILAAGAASGALLLASNAALALQVQVTVTNNAPAGGVYLTPVWAGFHDGSFDSFNAGEAAAPGLEAIAEDGNVGPISDVFDGTLTGDPVAGRVQGVVGSAPIGPGGSQSQTFDISDSGLNTYFSYASMVLTSNDYFVANGDPLAISIADILDGITNEISFTVGTPGSVYDAGTEVNDFSFAAGNGFFPGLGPGQGGPNQGTDENGVVTAVTGDPYANFLNANGFDTSLLNFNNTSLYTNGIATITISVVNPVPVPAALPLMAGALGLLGFVRRRFS
ncbi:MAG: spondin domain-containing protein [Pseudomonadota bacterium]